MKKRRTLNLKRVLTISAFLSLLLVSGHSHADLADGLVGHWKLDEGSGTTTADSSGNGHNAILEKGPVWIDGLFDKALEFDGYNDYVNCGKPASFEPTTGVSISAWIKSSTAGKYAYMVSKPGPTEGSSYALYTGYGALSYFYVVTTDGSAHLSPSGGEINDGIWHHVVGTYDKLKVRLYIDGVEAGTGTDEADDIDYTNSDDLIIGSYGKVHATGNWPGLIDEVRVYNRALTPAEVDELYAMLPQLPPVAYDQSLDVLVNTPKDITLKGTDVNKDPLTYIIVTEPAHGSRSGTLPDITYTPFNNYLGEDSIVFKVNDGQADSNEATVSINVVPPSFPGAEGFGAVSKGGRGGSVVHVTNLTASGSGSLREAVSGSDPRIIVFDVGGVIEISDPITVGKNFTLAGQTAPGGITITGAQINVPGPWPIGDPVLQNFVMRHIRLRGDHNYDRSGNNMDNMGILSSRNFIIDHVSMTGSGDESFSVYGSTDFTLQWCTIEESGLFGQGGCNHDEGNHNLGFLMYGPEEMNITVHHNVIANHKARLPKITIPSGVVDFRNNVIYNWESWGSNLNGAGYHNVIGNTYIVGPSVEENLDTRPFVIYEASTSGHFYPQDLSGNKWIKDSNSQPADMPSIYLWRAEPPIWEAEPAPAPPVTTESAQDGYNSVLNKSGAWPRDATTRRTVAEVQTSTATGGRGLRGPYEYLPEKEGPCSAANDTDRDGMPDDWETAHSLDPNNPDDRNDIVPASVSERHKDYTYIEFYINELSDNLVEQDGSVYTIQSGVSPADSGTVLSEHGNHSWEVTGGGNKSGYNSPDWLGRIEFGTARYNDGSIVIMKAKPKPGYAFDHWAGDPVEGLTATQISFPATTDANITAHFVALQDIDIDIVISPEDSGGVAGDGTYKTGEIVTLAAYSNDGYKFKRWVGVPVDGTANPLVQFPATQNYNITAEFEPGSGGDFIIDNFDDQDEFSLLINSAGNPKKWSIGSSNYSFHEVSSGNFALTYPYRFWGNLILGYGTASWRPEEETSDIPEGTTVLKFKIYNIGQKETSIFKDGPWDFAWGSEYDFMGFRLTRNDQDWNTTLHYADPLGFPTIQPGESTMWEIPISLIREHDLTKTLDSNDKFKYFNFQHFFGVWDTQIALDDAAFGRSGIDPASLPNLSPIANAGRDQTAKDCDDDGKEVVWLNGLKSYDSNAGLIASWSWKIGDTEIATGFVPRVELGLGTHNITLTVSDEEGLSSSDTVTITVLESGGGQPGDVDGDGDVDIFDLFAVASAFGTVQGDTGYNPNCDFDSDGDVDINDLYTCGSNFGVGV